MGFDGLTVFVLQQIRERALKSARGAPGEGRGVPPGLYTVTRRLVTDQPDPRIVDERVEDADRIRPAANARRDRVGQPARLLHNLYSRFEADHPLKVAHHRRERM